MIQACIWVLVDTPTYQLPNPKSPGLAEEENF